jgi:hypothetical protein
MDLTDNFTWEDLPTRDAHTGRLTAAGWIPRILKYIRRAGTAIFLIHLVQSTIRIVTNNETIFTSWYPFDWTISPFYELVNISQVTISLHQRRQFMSNLFSYCSQFNILTYPIPLLLSFLYFTTPSIYQTAELWMAEWLIIRSLKEFGMRLLCPDVRYRRIFNNVRKQT